MEDNQLTQPILNPISAFDATQQYTFTFVVIGGNQVVANMLTINDNSDGSQVYQATQSTMRLEHVLPANTLENGHYYSVTVQTIDNAEQLSEASVAVPFYCYSTPSLTISNMPSSGTINNNSYTFQGAYSQSEGEALNSYQFTLYNNNREVISQTPLIYYSSDSSLQYTFTGMSSNTSYFIELSGQTVNGTQITSGILPFNVNYSSSASFAICDLVNDCENGYIQISSNVVAIQGNSNPEPPIYIDDKEVDLREDGSYVNWDSGFNIQNDFTMRVWGRDFNPYEDIINMSNNQDSDGDPNRINMKWMLGDIDKELPEYNSFSNNFVNLQDSIEEDIQDFMICGNSIQKTEEEQDYGTGNSLQINTANKTSITMEVLGNEYQATREGYNVLQNKLTSNTINGVTFTVNEDKSVTLSGTATNSIIANLITGKYDDNNATNPLIIPENITNYRLSGCPSGGSWSTYKLDIYSKDYALIGTDLGEGADISKNSGDISELARVRIVVYKGAVLNNVTFYPMITYGTEEKPYQEYGASPSPDYPSEVEVVGDNVNIFDKDNMNKMLATPSGLTVIASSRGGASFYLEVKSNTDYTISRKIVGSRFVACTSVQVPTVGTSLTQNIINNSGDVIHIKTSTNDKYLLVYYLYNNTENEEEILSSIKVEEGTVATSYSPYGQGSVEIKKSNNLSNFTTLGNGLSSGTYNGLTFEMLNKFSCKISGKPSTNELRFGNPYNSTTILVPLERGEKYKIKNSLNSTSEITLVNSKNNTYRMVYVRNMSEIPLQDGDDGISSVRVYVDTNKTYDNEIVTCVIYTQEDDDFIPEEQSYILDIQQPMLSGDYFVKEADGWKEVHGWNKYEFTGEENITYYNAPNIDKANTASTAYFTIDLPKLGENDATKKGNVFCNCFSNLFDATDLWANSDNEALSKEAVSLQGTLRIRINKTRLTNYSNDMTSTEKVNLMKQYLTEIYNTGNPIYVYYKLATPTKLPCTEAQSNVLDQLNINESYTGVTNIFATDDLTLIDVRSIEVPSTTLPSTIYSVGDIKNLINIENFNITYSQQYSQDTNTQFILKPNYTYTLSFDYLINNATTDLYYSIGYGTTSYTTDIATQIQYNTQIEGRNYYTFTVPANIPENNYLWIKFGQTIILADINVDISNIQLEKGIYNTAYQSPSIYNIYNVIAQKNVFNNNETLYIKDNNTTHTTITNGYNIVPTSTTEETYLAIGYNNVLQEGNTYAISLNSLGQFDSIKLYMTEKGSQEIYSEIELTNNSFIAPSNLYDLQICIYVDNSSLDNYAEIWNIQIEANTTPTTYESYNGIVSTFSLDDTLKSTPYTRDLICLKSPNILNNSGEADVIGDEDYYYSQLGTTSYNISYINEDNNVISSLDITNGVLHTPANCVKIKVNNLNSEDITNNRLQINRGTSAFGYYPYFENPSMIRWVKRVILDGVTNGKKCTYVNASQSTQTQIAITIPDVLKSSMALCNIASSVSPGVFGFVNTIVVSESNSQIFIHAEPNIFSTDVTVSGVNTWLNNLYTQGTPIYIDYITETPEITELTEQQITLLQNAKSNQGITNIYMNNSYPALLTGEYANSYSVQETQNAYVILRCYNNNNLPYIITSNYIDIPSDTDKVFIWVRRVNNIFDLRIENLGDYSEGGGGDDTTDPVVTIEADPIITSNSITITANAIDDTGLRTIRFSKNNGSTWDEERAIDGLSVTEEYTFADLTADTQYAIRVEAIDLSGNIGGISEQLTTATS